MTIHNALLIDIEPHHYGSFLCTFCIKRDKFNIAIPNVIANTLQVDRCYDIDFTMDITNVVGAHKFSLNFITPTQNI